MPWHTVLAATTVFVYHCSVQGIGATSRPLGKTHMACDMLFHCKPCGTLVQYEPMEYPETPALLLCFHQLVD